MCKLIGNPNPSTEVESTIYRMRLAARHNRSADEIACIAAHAVNYCDADGREEINAIRDEICTPQYVLRGYY